MADNWTLERRRDPRWSSLIRLLDSNNNNNVALGKIALGKAGQP